MINESPRRPRRRSVIAVALLTSLTGCQSWFHEERPAITAPVADVRVIHFAGTALSGPQAQSADLSNPWSITAGITAIESTTPAGFERVGPQARLVIGPETGTVVSPSSRLIYSTLIRPLAPDEDLDVSLGDAQRRARMGDIHAAIPLGVTASFEVGLPDGTPEAAIYSRRAVRVQVYRRATDDTYDVAIVSDDLIAAARGATSSAKAREVIVIGRKLNAGSDRFAIAIPMSFPRSTAKAIVIELKINSSSAIDDAAVAQMKEQVDASSTAVAALRTSALPTPEELAIARSLESLGDAGASPRAALTFLAERTGAKLAESVALVADDRLLQFIAGDVQSRLARLPARDRRSVSWLLDRATIGSLATVKEEDAARVLPPIQGALSIYAGEAGRQLDVLRSLADESNSSEDLYNRIVAENLILLEESSPGLRVRACDWLRAAGRAPEGYDPLASPQQRRAALERGRAAATQPTTQPANVPTASTP